MPLSRQRGNVIRYLFEYAAFFCMASFTMALRLRRYQVIHTSNLPDFLVFSALLPKLFGTRVLLDEHDPMPELFMSKYGVGKSSRIIRMVRLQERLSLRLADHILTVNDAMKQRFVPLAGKTPVSVVMNLPDDKLFVAPQPRSAEPRTDGRFVLLYTGTVSKTYDLSMVVEAVAGLKSRIPNLYLKIVGEGDDIPCLRNLAKERGIEDSVEFCGVVPFNRIPEIIMESDLGISTLKLDMLTDLCFNNKTAEYVMMGLPTIATRTSTVQRHFGEKIVRFFDAGNAESFIGAIIELYENPEKRVEMSRLGIEFSKSANWSVEKQKYIDLVDELCGRMGDRY